MRRASTTQRGYDSTHQRERRMWEPLVASGSVHCRRAGYDCLRPDDTIIHPDEAWDLGHPDETCPEPKAPEHQRCNRAAGGRNGARVSNRTRQMIVRPW